MGLKNAEGRYLRIVSYSVFVDAPRAQHDPHGRVP